jgi:hypothetical protein
MQLIERYIYDVTRRLPEADRSEVKREIEANISDMLPDNPNEQDIADVLTQMGAPAKLAEQYRQNPRYLISPPLYDSFISVLKSVTIAVACVCACVGVLTALSSIGPDASAGRVIHIVLEDMLSSAFSGAAMAVFWITVGFVIADRSGYKGKEWTVADIPNLPDSKGVLIPRTSTIAGMSIVVIFTFVFVSSVRNGWLFGGAMFFRGTEIISPFSQAALERSIPFVIASVCAALAVSAFKLVWGRWNIPVCLANIVYNIVWLGIAIHILQWSDLIDPSFFVFIGRIADDVSLADKLASGNNSMGIPVLIAILCIAAVIDIGASIWNTLKGMQGSGGLRRNLDV